MLDRYNVHNVKHPIPIKLRGAVLQILVRLAQAFGELPPHVNTSVKIGHMQLVAYGSFGDIYRSTGNETRLALKVLRLSRGAQGQAVRSIPYLS